MVTPGEAATDEAILTWRDIVKLEPRPARLSELYVHVAISLDAT